jgi:soluble lytic murein transglycosylase-like protein
VHFKTDNNLIRKARTGVIALAAAGALGTGAASAGAATDLPEFEIEIDRQAIKRSIEAAEHRRDYRQLWEEAKKLKVEPKDAALSSNLGPAAAEGEVDELAKKVRKAKQPEFGTPESVGVDVGTLESIASCESGGDPTAISSDGSYRGKYQFDMGTWASVGGSGDPAAAPEAEQDYRAALLYSQAGASPWPVCGS